MFKLIFLVLLLAGCTTNNSIRVELGEFVEKNQPPLDKELSFILVGDIERCSETKVIHENREQGERLYTELIVEKPQLIITVVDAFHNGKAYYCDAGLRFTPQHDGNYYISAGVKHYSENDYIGCFPFLFDNRRSVNEPSPEDHIYSISESYPVACHKEAYEHSKDRLKDNHEI